MHSVPLLSTSSSLTGRSSLTGSKQPPPFASCFPSRLMEEFPNNGSCCILQSCLHRCSWEGDTVTLASLCLPFLTFRSRPFSVSHWLWVHTLPWPSTQQRLREKHIGASQEQSGKHMDTIPSYSIHWNLPFPLTFPFLCLLNVFLPYYCINTEGKEGGQISTRFLIFCENTTCLTLILRLQ